MTAGWPLPRRRSAAPSQDRPRRPHRVPAKAVPVRRHYQGLTEGNLVPRLARPDLTIGGAVTYVNVVEGVVLLVAVADLDALGAAEIDLVFALRCPGRVQQGHQLLGGLDDGWSVSAPEVVSAFASGACQVSGSAACSSRATSADLLPCELGGDELLQLSVGGLDRIADTVSDPWAAPEVSAFSTSETGSTAPPRL